jgi:hypothetical protein
MCSKLWTFSFLRSMVNLPLIISSGVMTVLNSMSDNSNEMKYANMVLNTWTSLILSIMGNFKLTEQVLLLILREGVQHRRRKLTVLYRAQFNERIRRFHEHRRQRLDTPKSKEIEKLLQPAILDVRMKCDRTFTWIEAVFGVQLASSLTNSSHHGPDDDHEMAPTILASPTVTVEFTRRSQTEWKLRISPVSELTNFLELRPTLLAGEYVKVNASSGNALPANTRNGLCHEETFFATNAMNHRSTCPRFPTCSGSLNDITPMSKVRDKTRTIKFFYHKCTELYDSVTEQGL